LETDALEKARSNQGTVQKNGQHQEVRAISESLSASENNSSKEPEKRPEPKDKTKPISSTPVTGTPWYVTLSFFSITSLILKHFNRCVVWTGDMKVFFYNPSTKTSIWERPHELKNRPDVDKLLKAPAPADDKVTDQSGNRSDHKSPADQIQNVDDDPESGEESDPPAKKSK
jgi:transcription elongation regulator 1